eukprot:m.72633 g.72633  ORF g.72633 m.72633 type:complete len:838 (+) comp16979_c0_seq2:149-2662(+)
MSVRSIKSLTNSLRRTLSGKKKGEHREHPTCLYGGSFPIAEARSDVDLFQAMQKFVRKEARKVAVEITKESVTLRKAKTMEVMARVADSLCLWASFNEHSNTMGFVEVKATGDPVCHVLRGKAAGQIYETIVRQYGIRQVGPAGMESPEDGLAKRTTSIMTNAGQQQRGDGTMAVFEAWFVGSHPVSSKRGEEATQEAVAHFTALAEEKKKQLGDKAEEMHESGLPGSAVALVVSTDGIRTLDSLTRAVVHSIFICDVSYATVCFLANGQELFACISHNAHLERSVCYLFSCGEEQADAICQILGAAARAYAESRTQDASPFDAVPNSSNPSVEVPRGLLAKELPRDYIVPVKPLGLGQFGRVFLATLAVQGETEEQFTVRILRSSSESESRDFCNSALNMVALDHPNIVRLIGVCMMQQPWMTITEFAPYGDLGGFLRLCTERKTRLSVLEQLQMVKQVALGVNFLHSKRMVHMDVASRNCLLFANNVVKIGSFVLAKRFDDGFQHYTLRERSKLSLRWLAVETYTQDPKIFSAKSDCWSFGVFIWEVLSYASVPYTALKLQDVHRMVPKGLRLARPEGSSVTMFEIAERCWAENPTARPSFSELEKLLDDEINPLKESSGPARDIGTAMNEELSQNLKKLTRRASAQYSQRRASSQMSLAGSALASDNEPKTRPNPLFALIEDDEEEEEEAEEEAERRRESTASGESRKSAIRALSFEYDHEDLVSVEEVRRNAGRVPETAFIAGDKDAVRRQQQRLEIDLSRLRLGGDGKDLTGRKKSIFHTTDESAMDSILLVPRSEPEEERNSLLRRGASQSALELNPDTYIPNSGDSFYLY